MEFRTVTAGDVGCIVKLMRDFAAFENLSDYCLITEEKLGEALFGSGAFVEAAVAASDESIVAYAMFYPHFASFRGQTGYYLEDIFVAESHRGRRIGESLLRFVARLAAARGYERIDFQVLDWNEPAVDFYLRLGAERNESERHFKFSDNAFRRLAA